MFVSNCPILPFNLAASSSREIFLTRWGNKEQSCLEFVEPEKQKGVARWLRRISPAGQGRGMAQTDADPEEENHFMIREADLPAKVRLNPARQGTPREAVPREANRNHPDKTKKSIYHKCSSLKYFGLNAILFVY